MRILTIYSIFFVISTILFSILFYYFTIKVDINKIKNNPIYFNSNNSSRDYTIIHYLMFCNAIHDGVVIREGILQPNIAISVYRPTVGECNDHPDLTAFGYKIDLTDPYKHRYCAVSRDLRHLKGKTIYIGGCDYLSGFYIVADLMNKRWINAVDILIDTNMQIGKWNGEIYY
jgi:3D (Asp-Asp-Asp) domain-containing protein